MSAEADSQALGILENNLSARSKLPPYRIVRLRYFTLGFSVLTCNARKISVKGDIRIMKPQTIIDEL